MRTFDSAGSFNIDEYSPAIDFLSVGMLVCSCCTKKRWIVLGVDLIAAYFQASENEDGATARIPNVGD